MIDPVIRAIYRGFDIASDTTETPQRWRVFQPGTGTVIGEFDREEDALKFVDATKRQARCSD